MNLFKLVSIAACSFTLSGCLFGENKQFFGSDGAAAPTGTGASPTPGPVTPSPTATPIGMPTATPVTTATPASTPEPTPTPIFFPTPTPVPTATPRPTATPAPTATPCPTSTPRPPVAVADGPYEIPEGTTFTMTDATLMSNDSDPNSLPLSFVSAHSASIGAVSTSGTNVLFTPPAAFVGTATFTYTISNSAGLSASANVTVNVRAIATLPIYAASMDSKLYTFNPGTNAVVYVSTLTLNGHVFSGSGCIGGAICEIAITPNGLMYAVDGRKLYYVNAATGVMTPIDITLSGAYELSALHDGTLIISSTTESVIYNLTTNVITHLPLENWIRQGGGDAIALPDGNLYMTIYESHGPDHLIRIDPNTGAETDIGSVGFTEVWGLGYDSGVMYGFTGHGAIFTIDPKTGNSVLYYSASVDWATATTNPLLW